MTCTTESLQLRRYPPLIAGEHVDDDEARRFTRTSPARGEVTATAELWYYAATLAQYAYGDAHNALGEEYPGLSLREPVGVVGIITPWNFPLLIVSQNLK